MYCILLFFHLKIIRLKYIREILANKSLVTQHYTHIIHIMMFDSYYKHRVFINLYIRKKNNLKTIFCSYRTSRQIQRTVILY